MKYLIGSKEQKQFRMAGMVMFASWCALVLWRIVMYFLPIENDLAADAAFTLPVQLGILLALPFLSYRFGLKMSDREVLAFSNVRKCPVPALLVAVPLGFCAFFATIGISTLWQTFLMLLGYNHSYSTTAYPEQFNVFMFLASLFLTAVLPAVCEEFSVRGGLLTAVASTKHRDSAVLLMGLLFGLFHQNVTQFFYTALFGMVIAYIALKHRSILPCMIVHFINNGVGVYLDYAEAYGWWGYNFYDWINARLQSNAFSILTLYVLILGLTVFLVYLTGRFAPDDTPRKTRPADHAPDAPMVNVNPFEDTGINPFAEDVPPHGAFDPLDPFAPAQPIDPFDGKPLDPFAAGPPGTPHPAPRPSPSDVAFRPSLRDKAFYIGAIVLSVLTTLFSFFWGLF